MFEVIPELIDGAVVCNVFFSQDQNVSDCSDYVVYIHNWLMETELQYLIIDLQDHKDVCPGMLEALLHLKKRLKFPFLFAGVVEKPEKILKEYNYNDFPIFLAPEDAVRALRIQHPDLTEQSTENVKFGEPIFMKKEVSPEETAEGDEEIY